MTFTANQRLTIVLSVLASIALSFIIGYNIDRQEAPTLLDRTMTECEAYITDSDDMAGLLLSYGWKGDYRDKSDSTFYSPSCNIPTAPWLTK